MLLTITTTHRPATDLGYLLHKHPGRVQTFALTFGQAHVFYPQADAERCTAALLLDVDPHRPGARPRQRSRRPADRLRKRPPLRRVVVHERGHRSRLRQRAGWPQQGAPELVDVPLPLTATVAALPCRGGEEVLRRLFEPLDYAVSLNCASDHAPSRYRNLCLEGRKPLAELLAHLYVLIPVLDNDKHYWVGDDEVDKLVQHGGSWLGTHPERDLIAKRYPQIQAEPGWPCHRPSGRGRNRTTTVPSRTRPMRLSQKMNSNAPCACKTPAWPPWSMRCRIAVRRGWWIWAVARGG